MHPAVGDHQGRAQAHPGTAGQRAPRAGAADGAAVRGGPAGLHGPADAAGRSARAARCCGAARGLDRRRWRAALHAPPPARGQAPTLKRSAM
ncbi:MAG: hypothetical protein EPO53_27420 [Variovorax sp.]|nr:MAG: hypothetical protein EPO53_27420 [Variovorax sp.]